MAHVGETLGSVPNATEGEELDERMYTYCLLFCSSDPTGETLKIAMKLFPGKVRCCANKGRPGCVSTSVPCHTAVIKCGYVVRTSLRGDSGRSGRQLVIWHLQWGSREMTAAWSPLTQPSPSPYGTVLSTFRLPLPTIA